MESSKAILVNMDDAVTKLELGARYGYDDWRRKAYDALVTRLNSLSVEEVRRIGLEATAQISRIRDVRLKSMFCSKNPPSRGYSGGSECCPHCLKPVYMNSTYLPACKPCGITFYGASELCDKYVSKRVNDEISKLFPPTPTTANTGVDHDGTKPPPFALR